MSGNVYRRMHRQVIAGWVIIAWVVIMWFVI